MNEEVKKKPRKRSRSRNRKGSSSIPDNGRAHAQNSARKAMPKINLVEFWGDPEALPRPEEASAQTQDPRALLESLGRPPLPAQEIAAQRSFTLVYERAAFLAGALAAATVHDPSD